MTQVTWGIGWYSKGVLTVIAVVLVGLSVGQLPGKVEAEPERNHRTLKALRIAHTVPAKGRMIKDCADLGFNVVHTNDTHNMDGDSVYQFLEKCKDFGVMGLPRIDRGPHVETTIEKIKDHANLLGVISDDETEGERIPLSEQIDYYSTVKSIAPNILVFRGWNGSSPNHSWDEYFPPKDKIKNVCDVVFFAVYPWGTVNGKYIPEKWMRSERDRALPYLNRDTPLVPIMQGFYGERFKRPNMQIQWDFWKELCNSYAIWLHGAGNAPATGFAEDNELREQVRKLNKEVGHVDR